jgi:hypothetical protein
MLCSLRLVPCYYSPGLEVAHDRTFEDSKLELFSLEELLH